MIRKPRYGLAAHYELTIDGVPVRYQSITGLELDLSKNQHDMLTMTHLGINPKAILDYVGAPVRLAFDTGSNLSHEFVGYIQHQNPHAVTHQGLVNGSPFQATKITALGVSYEMRGKNSKTWAGMRLHEVAGQLAKKHGLSLDVPRSPSIVSPDQSNESDWQYIVRYASLLGYEVTCHGTHLHIFDPYQARGRQISLHKLISPRTLGPEGRPIPGAILDFNPTFADRHPDGEYMNSVVTVAYDDGTTFDVSTNEVRKLSTPARFTNRVQEVADNYAEAVRLVQTADKATYDWMGEVTVMGLAGALPGGLVDVDEYGGGFDGLWYVQSVKHSLTSERFITDLSIVRNRNSEIDAPSPVAPFTTPPAPAFVTDRFRTSKAVRNVY